MPDNEVGESEFEMRENVNCLVVENNRASDWLQGKYPLFRLAKIQRD
jgi:hypothetical protein